MVIHLIELNKNLILYDSYINISQMYNIIGQLISSDILCDCYLLFWNVIRSIGIG